MISIWLSWTPATLRRKDTTRARPREWWAGAPGLHFQSQQACWSHTWFKMCWKAFFIDKPSNENTMTKDQLHEQQLHEGEKVKIQPVTSGQRLWTDRRATLFLWSTGIWHGEWWNRCDPVSMKYRHMARCTSEIAGICESMNQGMTLDQL